MERRIKQHALSVLLAGLLLGALIFLFIRTVSIDFRGDAQALALLRELKDFDARRDVDALRITTDFEIRARPSDWSALRARALRDLEKDPARAAVSTQLSSIQHAMQDKENAYYELTAAHTASVQALKGADDALTALVAGATGPRLRNGAAPTLAANIERLRGALREGNIERTTAVAHELEARAAMLRPALANADPLLLETADRAESAVDAFIAARATEASAWRKFAYTTAGGRIELASQAASHAIDRALDERERWLVYLLAYAAAFALGAGYVGLRAFASLQRLRAANADLAMQLSQRSSDVTELLHKHQQAETQLLQSTRMASLGKLLTGVSQDLGRPLARVRDNLFSTRNAMPDVRDTCAHAGRLVELLRARPAEPARVEAATATLDEHLRRVQALETLDELETLSGEGLAEMEQAAELLARLRSFARPDCGHVGSFNVNDGVDAALIVARPLLQRVDVEKSLGDVPPITCSPSQVNQVLLNLVANAAESIDKPRGRITVTTRSTAPGGVAIDVADNGKGIASDALARIFEGSGTGVGLSVAHRIVSSHGGRIEVRSQLGVGSIFTVTLPMRPPQQEPMASESSRSVLA
jgi:signal transduction histidine kinase